jgi:hypothetical protein
MKEVVSVETKPESHGIIFHAILLLLHCRGRKIGSGWENGVLKRWVGGTEKVVGSMIGHARVLISPNHVHFPTPVTL